MHFGDSIFIFLLALVLFGPKKLPEIGRTVGKLLAEFRRASNEFKFQIQEELRNMEEDERRKKLAEVQTQKTSEAPIPAETALPASSAPAAPTILPPSTGTPVSTGRPYAAPEESAEPTPAAETIAPSAAEVVVERAAPEAASASSNGVAAGMPEADIDRSTGTNGAHAPVPEAEPVPSGAPSETIHHG